MQIMSLYSRLLAPPRLWCHVLSEQERAPSSLPGAGSQTMSGHNSIWPQPTDSIYSLLSALPRPFQHWVFAPINSVPPSVSKHLISTSTSTRKVRKTARTFVTEAHRRTMNLMGLRIWDHFSWWLSYKPGWIWPIMLIHTSEFGLTSIYI